MKKYRVILLISLSLILIAAFLALGYLLVSNNNDNSKDNSHSKDTNNRELIVLISLDGFGSNLLDEDAPFLSSMIQQPQTSYTLNMQTLQQSETMPSHVSMVTGLTQEHHGFYANSVNESTPTLKSKTVFDYAIENNYSYYAFMTKEKLLYLLGGKPGENIKFKDGFSSTVMTDIDNLVETNNEKVFVFIHLRDLDSIGHSNGWGSEQQNEAMQSLDHNVQLIKDDLDTEFSSYERYYIITADHGGEGTNHGSGCPACRTIPLIIESDNTNDRYTLENRQYNIYDVTCVVTDLMGVKGSIDADCAKKF